MYLDNLIFKSYESQIDSARSASLKVLHDELLALCAFGEKWSQDVKIPERVRMKVPVIYEVGGKPMEVYEERLWWPLEPENRHLLKYVDDRLAQSFRTLKKAGFSRPSSVLYGSMFVYLHSEDIDSAYNGRPQEWAGVSLVLRRIWSTSRISFRFEDPDRLGRRVVLMEDGTTEIRYGAAQWKSELIKRGLVSRRKKG